MPTIFVLFLTLVGDLSVPKIRKNLFFGLFHFNIPWWLGSNIYYFSKYAILLSTFLLELVLKTLSIRKAQNVFWSLLASNWPHLNAIFYRQLPPRKKQQVANPRIRAKVKLTTSKFRVRNLISCLFSLSKQSSVE